MPATNTTETAALLALDLVLSQDDQAAMFEQAASAGAVREIGARVQPAADMDDLSF